MKTLVLLSSACLLTSFASPQMPQAVQLSYSLVKGSRVFIDGVTNVRDFHCVSGAFFSGLRASFLPVDSGSVLEFSQADLSVDIASLDCGGRGINRDLFRILRASDYPSILIRLRELTLISGAPWGSSPRGVMQAKVLLTLLGCTRSLCFLVQGTREPEAVLRARGCVVIYLSDFGIQPPRALFGTIRVRDAVRVTFDLRLRLEAPPSGNS